MAKDHNCKEIELGDELAHCAFQSARPNVVPRDDVPVLTHDKNENGQHRLKNTIKALARAVKPVPTGVGFLDILEANYNVTISIVKHPECKQFHRQQGKYEHEKQEDETEVGHIDQTLQDPLQDLLKCLPNARQFYHSEQAQASKGVHDLVAFAVVVHDRQRQSHIYQRDQHDNGIKDVESVLDIELGAFADQLCDHLQCEGNREELVTNCQELRLF